MDSKIQELFNEESQKNNELVENRIKELNYLLKRNELVDVRNAFVRTRLTEDPLEYYKLDLDVANLPLEINQDRFRLSPAIKKKLKFDKLKQKYQVDRTIKISPEDFAKGNLNKDHVISKIIKLNEEKIDIDFE